MLIAEMTLGVRQARRSQGTGAGRLPEPDDRVQELAEVRFRRGNHQMQSVPGIGGPVVGPQVRWHRRLPGG